MMHECTFIAEVGAGTNTIFPENINLVEILLCRTGLYLQPYIFRDKQFVFKLNIVLRQQYYSAINTSF